jgi:hypothetical protein
MSIKVYRSGTLIRIDGSLLTVEYMVPGYTLPAVTNEGSIRLVDSIRNRNIHLGTYDNILDRNDDGFVSLEACLTYLSNLVNTPQSVDKSTGSVVCIDYEHNEIHSGDHYFYADKNTVDAAGVIEYLITTPDTDKKIHFVFNVDGTVVTSFDLYEGSDKVGTTLQSVFNNNRDSDNEATLIIHKGVSGGTTDGVLMFPYSSGTSTNQSKGQSKVRAESEIMLKRNAKYLLRITSGTNGNLTNTFCSLYEHTDKI